MAQELLQFIGEDGKPSKKEADAPAGLTDDQLREIHRWMLLQRVIDDKMLVVQRQGRVGFYGPIRGQEAGVIGSVYALKPQDWIFSALREAGGAAFMRGMPLERLLAENFATSISPQKGRQMPCHYSWRDANVVAWSSVIATQIPHAVGCAMAMKRRGDDAISIGYMGDGATSEGDFHVAMNFAGVYKAPVVLFCQNNQWAISVPVEKQTASKTIAMKAAAYGFDGIRVDGNDVLAVYAATKEAADRARSGKGPTFIEALTYRMGPHSSSDDPNKYRDEAVTKQWAKRDPVDRFQNYLLATGRWDAKRQKELKKELDSLVAAAIAEAEEAGPPAAETLVEDVFAETTPRLRRQLDWVEDG
jgi:pyruvate dehydrogenase E1 component alpha subunit/2-oxoisovalerate dehydrogenase E1 component alpha subunit